MNTICPFVALVTIYNIGRESNVLIKCAYTAITQQSEPCEVEIIYVGLYGTKLNLASLDVVCRAADCVESLCQIQPVRYYHF